tara:strand:- start:253 stop:930 length:678 start_codon:yes stop_codon:yes gene_type:complete
MSTQMSSNQWKIFYKNNQKNKNYFPESFVQRIFSSKKPIKFLDHKYLNKIILDAGCGYGRNIPFLRLLNFKLHGMEVSNDQIDFLKTNFPECEFKKGIFASIPFKNNYFDYILACNSIYYVDDVEDSFHKHLLEIKRVLKYKGFFILSMLGEKHSILNNSKKLKNNHYLIKNDFLNFRNNLIVRVFKNEKLEIIFNGFIVKHHGQVIENVKDIYRHIHYFVLQNK